MRPFDGKAAKFGCSRLAGIAHPGKERLELPAQQSLRRLPTCPTLLLIVLLVGCKMPGEKQDFAAIEEEFVYGSLALSPVGATSAGYHEHKGKRLDEMLDDFSPSGIAEQRAFYRDFHDRLEIVKPESLSSEERADYRMMEDQIQLALLDINLIRSYVHNPAVYVELLGNALFNPFVLEYAPKPQRFRHIIKRLEHVPALMREARDNLKDSPEVWTSVAQEENDGNIRLIDVTLRSSVPNELKADFDKAAAEALDALRKFNEYLKNDLAKRITRWQLGKEKYDLKFQWTLDVGKTPEQVLAEAEDALKSVTEEMKRLAGGKSIPEALNEIAQEHATPATYMDEARRDLQEATAFVKAKNLAPLPGRANLKVIETPEFMRGVYGVGGFNAAPALEPQLGAFYWVTPIPANWPPQRVDSKLREYNRYGMQELTIHEAMPGHYVQLEYANNVEPKTRRVLRNIYGNGPYVEGWATYVQQVMSDEGYLNNSVPLRMTFLKQMLRVITNAIMDVRMQTMEMSDKDAMDLMIRQGFQETEEATAKLQRAKLTSCQLPMYFVGWRGWLRVREEYKRQKGPGFTLADFHSKALKESAVPLPVLGLLLSGK
jgi:uncharacterized protein (DUF885 family)